MTRKIFTAGLFLLLALPLAAQYQFARPQATVPKNQDLATFASQQRVLFNFDWKFALGENENAAKPGFDDSGWRPVDLPHDFQFEQPWDMRAGGARGFKPVCEGWYRKSFRADTVWRGKQVSLDFGGIMYYGDVYLNGQKVGSSEYGYIGFEADITRALRYDTLNVVAVYANTGPSGDSRWYTGGGLFRDVYLQVRNVTHIARHGIFITTPEVSASKATVQVQAEIDQWQKHDTGVRAVIRDPEGNIVATTEGAMPEHTHQTCSEIPLDPVTIASPKLWHPDHPYLYTADVIVTADGVVADSVRETFGIRSLEFSPEFGLKINGEKIFVMGMANHHDLGPLGAASFDRAIERLMLKAKSFGFNAVRCAHNPYSESFTRIADRVGMLVVDELIDKWTDGGLWGGRKPFTQICWDLIAEWVRRDRNCPSVIMWSLGNELQSQAAWSGFQTNDWGVTTYRLFDIMVKRYDPTRGTTVAMFPSRAGAIRNEADFMTYLVPPEIAQVSDIASLNYQSNVYGAYLEHSPHMILFQSECQTSMMLWGFYNMDRDRTVGLAYWGAVDYWGESTMWPKKGWNFSFFDHALNPYPTAYLVQTAFKEDEPQVHIGVSVGAGERINWNDVQVGNLDLAEKWNFEAGSMQHVYTFTNAEEVELLVNGKSLGRQKNDAYLAGQDKLSETSRTPGGTVDNSQRNIVRWNDVPYEAGKLTAVAYNGGKEVARHTIETTGKAVALKVEVETPNDWKADGMDLQYIKAWAVDSKGRRVWDATDEVTFDVSGAATLYTVDNGDHSTDYLFTSDIHTKTMHRGFIQCVARSKREAGNVVVKVSCPGLKGATLKLKTL
ncbi:MAG: DUF4982 domain-containing protein [Bacteroidales bacterium]|nr:DUF4982 domain-containing protein [Bacteroidales bacterium]MCR5715109.1 DUF4982 domain-containing protein [Bacteroidales bacterium]